MSLCRVFASLAAAAAALSLAACSKPVYVQGAVFEPLESPARILAGSASGRVSGSLLGFSGSAESSLNSDVQRYPYRVTYTVLHPRSPRTGELYYERDQKTAVVDVFLQRAEVLDMTSPGGATLTLRQVQGTDEEQQLQTCLYVYYRDRAVEIVKPGNTVLACYHNE